MSSANMWALTSVQIMVFLVGLASNGFILVVNILDYIHSHPLIFSDYFMCSLALSNLLLQICGEANWMCEVNQETHPVCWVMFALKMISSSCSLLLTTWLCIYYCLRIVIFRHYLMIWLQRRIKPFYKYLIFSSMLLCLIMGLPLAWTGKELPHHTNTSAFSYHYISTYRGFLVLFVYAIPVFLVLLSAGLIIRSLTKHMRRMHITMKAGGEVCMEAHLQAGRTVMSLLLLYLAYFVISILFVIDLYPEGDPRLYICYLASSMYCPVHSIILIRGNTKLRRAAAGIIMNAPATANRV